MSNDLTTDTGDEPVIGLNYALPPDPIDDSEFADDAAADDGDTTSYYDEEAYDREERYSARDSYYDDGYDEAAPARQPLFYVFIALAALVGAAAVFVLFSVVRSGDDDAPPATPAADVQVQIASPKSGDRIRASQTIEVQARASANELIATFELLVDDKAVDRVDAVPPASGEIYAATLKTQISKRGEHSIVVRVTTAGGAKKDSTRLRVTVVEDLVGGPGDTAKAKVIATTTLRSGPGESFDGFGTVEPGTEVKVTGRSQDGEWLLIDLNGGRWIKRAAVEPIDSLANIPIREPLGRGTPTPGATAQLPTPTATAGAGAPDFVPVDARFVFSGGGRASLRLSIRNEGAAYAGPLVVGASTTPGGLVVSQLVFDVNIGAGKAITVDFDVSGQLPERADVTVRVDPGNAVREGSEDNNVAVFKGLAAPADPPGLVISGVNVTPAGINITVQNSGGPLGSSTLRVKITIGGNDASQSKTVTLARGETTGFSFPRFATGTGKVELFVNEVATASADVTVPVLGSPTTAPTTTATATASASATATATPQ